MESCFCTKRALQFDLNGTTGKDKKYIVNFVMQGGSCDVK